MKNKIITGIIVGVFVATIAAFFAILASDSYNKSVQEDIRYRNELAKINYNRKHNK